MGLQYRLARAEDLAPAQVAARGQGRSRIRHGAAHRTSVVNAKRLPIH